MLDLHRVQIDVLPCFPLNWLLAEVYGPDRAFHPAALLVIPFPGCGSANSCVSLPNPSWTVA